MDPFGPTFRSVNKLIATILLGHCFSMEDDTLGRLSQGSKALDEFSGSFWPRVCIPHIATHLLFCITVAPAVRSEDLILSPATVAVPQRRALSWRVRQEALEVGHYFPLRPLSLLLCSASSWTCASSKEKKQVGRPLKKGGILCRASMPSLSSSHAPKGNLPYTEAESYRPAAAHIRPDSAQLVIKRGLQTVDCGSPVTAASMEALEP